MFPLLDNIFEYLPVFYPESDEIIRDQDFIDEYDYKDFERQEEIEDYEYRERLRTNTLLPYEKREFDIINEQRSSLNNFINLFDNIPYGTFQCGGSVNEAIAGYIRTDVNDIYDLIEIEIKDIKFN